MHFLRHLVSNRGNSLRLLTPYVRGNKGKLTGAGALLLCYSALTVLPSLVMQLLIDDGFGTGRLNIIILLAVSLVVIAGAQSLLSVSAAKLLARVGQGIVSDFRGALVPRALSMPTDWLSNKDDGYIASRINEANNVSSLFSQTSFTFLSSILQAMVAMSLMASTDVRILFFAMLPIPVYFRTE